MKLLSIAFALAVATQIFADAPASQPAPDLKVLDASDTKALVDAAGMTVTVKGEISRFHATKTILLLNFKGVDRSGFCIAIKKADWKAVNDGFGGDIGANLKGKSIRVTGEVILYKEKPEIEVTKPEQIQVETK